MKIMVFSVTAGQGHNTTARVLAQELEARGHEAKVVDIFRSTNRLLYLTYDKGYLFAASRLKFLYGYFYYKSENRKTNSYTPSFARFFYRGIAKRLHRLVESYAPDAIVCTHPIGSAILDVMKERHGTRAKMIGVTTDFTMHPFWEDSLRFDRIIIPTEALSEAAKKKGLKEEQLLPLGIPISPSFSEKTDKERAREALGIPKDLPILLLMGGSMGYGRMDKTLKALAALPYSYGIITVCGKNKKAWRTVEKAKCSKLILNLGYTDKISLLMDASDAMVSKPGGLSTSEALAKELPFISIHPIPGQEIRNQEFLLDFGAAFSAENEKELAAAVRSVLENDEKAQSVRARAALLKKPCSSKALCDEIENLCSQTRE